MGCSDLMCRTFVYFLRHPEEELRMSSRGHWWRWKSEAAANVRDALPTLERVPPVRADLYHPQLGQNQPESSPCTETRLRPQSSSQAPLLGLPAFLTAPDWVLWQCIVSLPLHIVCTVLLGCFHPVHSAPSSAYKTRRPDASRQDSSRTSDSGGTVANPRQSDSDEARSRESPEWLGVAAVVLLMLPTWSFRSHNHQLLQFFTTSSPLFQTRWPLYHYDCLVAPVKMMLTSSDLTMLSPIYVADTDPTP